MWYVLNDWVNSLSPPIDFRVSPGIVDTHVAVSAPRRGCTSSTNNVSFTTVIWHHHGGAGMSEGKHTPRATRQSVSAPVVEPGRKDCIFLSKVVARKEAQVPKDISVPISQRSPESVRCSRGKRGQRNSLSCPNAREVDLHYHRDCFCHYTRVLEDKNDIDLSDSTGGEAQVLASFLEVVHKKDLRHRKRSSWIPFQN